MLSQAEATLFTQDPTQLPSWDAKAFGGSFSDLNELKELEAPGYERVILGEALIGEGNFYWPPARFRVGIGAGPHKVHGWALLVPEGVVGGEIFDLFSVENDGGGAKWFSTPRTIRPGRPLVVDRPEFHWGGFL